MRRFQFDWLPFVVLLPIAYLLFFKGLGDYYLWDPWEPKYAKALQEMLARRDFVTPYLNDEIRWTKPVLIYWAMLVPALFSGVNEWAVRLPSAVAATFGVFCVYHLMRRLTDRGTAIMAACILATMPQYFYLARQAMPDMLMTAFLTAAMAAFALGRFQPGCGRYFYGFYAFLALAFLAKGPVAGAITLSALALFMLVDMDWRSFRQMRTALQEIARLWRFYRVNGGIVVFIIVAAPWYAAMLWEHGHDFIGNFIGYENITRFKKPIRGHDGLITYYIQNLFHGMYPWSALLPGSVLFLFFAHTRLDEQARLRWYFVSWFFAVFIIFSFAGTKQQHYILPITPFVAILAAYFWQEYFKPAPAFWVGITLVLGGLFVWLTIRDFLLAGDGYLFDVFTVRLSIDHGSDIGDFLTLFLYAWLLLMAAALLLNRQKTVIAGLAVGIALLNGVYFTQVVMPAHTEARTLKPYIDLYRNQASDDAPLVFFSARDQSSIYYYFDKRRYQRIKPYHPDELRQLLGSQPDAFIIADRRYLSKLSNMLRHITGRQWKRVADSHAMFVLLKPDVKAHAKDGV